MFAFILGRFQFERPGGGLEGKVFENVLVGEVNMLFKCICRVVYNKSKCSSRGERERNDTATL